MTDPFAPQPDDGLVRDRHGRPKIALPDGGEAYYSRVSTIAKILDDPDNLMKWKVRTALLGMAAREDLYALIATKSPDDRQELNDLAERCIEAANGTVKRDLGTAIHSMTEAIDHGADISTQPAPWRKSLAAYRDALAEAGLRPVAAEVFVVNDELRCAGTLDRLLLEEATGEIITGDIKTGGVYIRPTQIQVAIYANSVIYDIATQQRHPLTVNRDRGVLIHIPQGEDRCDLIELDLIEGYRDAHLAIDVRASRRKPSGGGRWRKPIISGAAS